MEIRELEALLGTNAELWYNQDDEEEEDMLESDLNMPIFIFMYINICMRVSV